MRISVIIPTTDGPSQILRLTALKNAPRSVMRTQDDYRPLPVSSAYQSFAAQGGPMDLAFGIQAAAFDLRLTKRIDTGRSWEMPVALAHWLQGQGHEIGVDAPDILLWATGALDLDLAVITQDYHLADKLEASRELLQAAGENQSIRIVLLLPGATAVPHDLPARVELHHVDSFLEAQPKILARGTAKEQASAAPVASPKKRVVWGGMGVLGGIGAFAIAALLTFPPSNDPVPTLSAVAEASDPAPVSDDEEDQNPSDSTPETAPETETETELAEAEQAESILEAERSEPVLTELPVLTLLRPEGNASCVSVFFGNSPSQREVLKATTEGFGESRIELLCAIGIVLPAEAAGPLTVKVPYPLLPFVTRSNRQAEFVLLPGAERVLRLTSTLPASLGLSWQFRDEQGTVLELHHKLVAER